MSFNINLLNPPPGVGSWEYREELDMGPAVEEHRLGWGDGQVTGQQVLHRGSRTVEVEGRAMSEAGGRYLGQVLR